MNLSLNRSFLHLLVILAWLPISIRAQQDSSALDLHDPWGASEEVEQVEEYIRAPKIDPTANGGRKVTNYFRQEESQIRSIEEFTANRSRTGKWLHYHENGQVASVTPYVNNQISGIIYKYDQQGTAEDTAYYVLGDQINSSKPNYNFGKVITETKTWKGKKLVVLSSTGGDHGMIEGRFLDDLPFGEWISKLGDKVFARVKFNKDGEAIGESIYHTEEGVLLRRVTHDDATNIAFVEQFRPDGKLEYSKHTKEGLLHGEFKSFYEDGSTEQIGNYEYAKKAGAWNKYFHNLTKVGKWKLDAPAELVNTTWYEKGKLVKFTSALDGSLMQVVHMGPDALAPRYRAYYLDGQIEKEGEFASKGADRGYVQFEIHGTWKEFYPNGQLKVSGTKRYGKQLREWVHYYENGQLHYRIDMDKKRQDLTKYYDNGNVKSAIKYSEQGKLKNWKLFYVNGQLKSESQELAEINKLHGTKSEFYEDGRPKAISHYDRGKKVGEYLGYHKNGSLRAQGSFKMGEWTGEWNYYHENGSIEEQGSYESGEKVREWNRYHENGKLESKTTYENGKIEGQVDTYNQVGTLVMSSIYENDRETKSKEFDDEGRLMEYTRTPPMASIQTKQRYIYEDGRLIKIHEPGSEWRLVFDEDSIAGVAPSKDGVMNGEWKRWTQLTSKEPYVARHGHFLNGEKHGPFKYYERNFRSGSSHVDLIIEETYKHGLLDGMKIIYNKDGDGSIYIQNEFKEGKRVGLHRAISNGKVYEELNYDQNGELHGICKTYHGNGELARFNNYEHGELHGECKNFYENGQIRTDAVRSHGKEIGESKHYYSDGQLKEVTFYNASGKADGESVEYYKNGQIRRHRTYDNGTWVGAYKTYHENGKVKEERMYKAGKKHGKWVKYNSTGRVISTEDHGE